MTKVRRTSLHSTLRGSSSASRPQVPGALLFRWVGKHRQRHLCGIAPFSFHALAQQREHLEFSSHIVQLYSDGVVEEHRLRLLFGIVLPEREERCDVPFRCQWAHDRQRGVDKGGDDDVSRGEVAGHLRYVLCLAPGGVVRERLQEERQEQRAVTALCRKCGSL